MEILGAAYIDGVISSINNQNFNELEGKDNHDFDVDLAAVGINFKGNGMMCIIEARYRTREGIM